MISSEAAEQSPDYSQSMQALQRINFASIAKVCNTDAATVELVLKEVLAQIANSVKNGAILRINFRVGRIEFKNGEVNWKQFSEEYERNMRSFTTIKEMEGAKRSVTNSRYTKFQSQGRRGTDLGNEELTVRTPFTVQTKLGADRLSQTFNMANPNP